MASSRRRPLPLLILLSFVFVHAARHVSASHSHGHGHAHAALHDIVVPRALPDIVVPRALQPRETSAASTSGQDDYTCGPGKPCSNSACCGADGWCGYGSGYCGDGCQSNCDAVAECGEHAATAGATCPLNVCCSEFGFCGTTSDFCGDGCQSNCEQPKPSGAASDTQQKLIGYWEGWNMDHACGTMSIGEIPATLLTHLNVAFGYISHEFKVTNMDDVSTDVYRNIGNLKAKNADLKICIALGGWTFSDPGTWQDVFPTMVSTEANRATFITNLLGFLSEYGYDGVDFDWEYPGAEDRGGSDADADNYVSLLKELRAAIDASGHEYIVTFTAPTSYWYLRHFDVKNMEPYVDWINLMSYDLHGVWDSDNPIGSQVLAHSNLTEIDLALDLASFWRIGVDPSSIVLGLGFYGRSFELTSTSCWKPGCKFSGPGAAGPCTDSAGILSYKEIQDILTETGAKSYHDKTAAVRYLVYDENNWISYDDETTFQAKIDYANKMGLNGLMVWAIDQDDGALTALRSISTGDYSSSSSQEPFSLVDLEKIFPADLLPDDPAEPSYGLVTFGDGSESGEMDPTGSGFGFLIALGESHGLSNLKKREGKPEPFVFLDCPEHVKRQPLNQTQTARVVCLSEDVEGCFRVMERGVEGTVVEMPDNCARNSFARAISLQPAKDQSIPHQLLGKRTPTSEVMNFSFDFNILEKREDADLSVRFDITNAKNDYWNTFVDSEGVQSSSSRKRFFGERSLWKELYLGGDSSGLSMDGSLDVDEDISAPILWQTIDNCEVGGKSYGEGVAAFVLGSIKAQFSYGMTVIASLKSNEWVVSEANGFIKVKGSSDLTYGLGGVGTVDISRKGRSNPAWNTNGRRAFKSTSVLTAPLGIRLTATPYIDLSYGMATFNGTEDSLQSDSQAPFNGRLTTKVTSDFGDFAAVYPNKDFDESNTQEDNREANVIKVPTTDVLYSSEKGGGKIDLSTDISFNVDFSLSGLDSNSKTQLPTLMLHSATGTEFSFAPGEDEQEGMSCATYDVRTRIYQESLDGDTVKWNETGMGVLIYDRQITGPSQGCFTDAKDSMSAWKVEEDTTPDPSTFLKEDVEVFSKRQKLDCTDSGCVGCDDGESPDGCCGCENLMVTYHFDDMDPCEDCNDEDGIWPGTADETRRRDVEEDVNLGWGADLDEYDDDDDEDDLGREEDDEDDNEDDAHSLDKRVWGTATMSQKAVTMCGTKVKAGSFYAYPAFPAGAAYPWEGIDNDAWEDISRYWGNASASCTDWSTAQLTTADVSWLGSNNKVRAPYQTEHVFEGQLIGDFMTQWLDKGQVKNQSPPPSNPQQKAKCSWSRRFFLGAQTAISNWNCQKEDRSGNTVDAECTFFQYMIKELGNKQYLDRLTIYGSRLNRKKGTIFTGGRSVTPAKYALMSNDAQLQSTKELGLIFTYLAEDEVWEAFCETYEAIYKILGEFDSWYDIHYGTTLGNIPSLQDEWQDYVRTSLDSLGARSKAQFQTNYDNRHSRGSSLTNRYELMWFANLGNKSLLKISGTCTHLPTRV